jgi:hypothetical protein
MALEWAANNPRDISAALCTSERWAGLVLVHAQVQVEETYARMGFVKDDTMGKWVEEGITHVGMWKSVEVPTDPDAWKHQTSRREEEIQSRLL